MEETGRESGQPCDYLHRGYPSGITSESFAATRGAMAMDVLSYLSLTRINGKKINRLTVFDLVTPICGRVDLGMDPIILEDYRQVENAWSDSGENPRLDEIG